MSPNPCLRSATVLATLLSCLWTEPALASLSLAEAEALAMEQDPTLARLGAESRSLREKSIADGQWQDPRLKLGVIAIPTDSYNFHQENMTQQQIGVQQAIPRGDSLKWMQETTQSQAEEMDRKTDWERQTIRREVRLAYLGIVYQEMAVEIILKSKEFFRKLVQIAQFRYASGKEKKQRILEASLAHARMDDRLLGIEEQEKQARAKLSTWIGSEAAFGEITALFPEFDDLPDLPDMPDQETLRGRLLQHPALRLAETHIRTRTLGVRLAEEKYKPAWMTDMTYSRRLDTPTGAERSPLVSVMVSLDIPLFTENRQDRVRNAQRMGVEAAQYGRDDQRRKLEAELETTLVELKGTRDRRHLFSFKLMPEALLYTQTTLTGYQSGVTELNDVIRAQLTELTVRLDRLKLQHTERTLQAKLLYLIGEQP